MSIKVMSKLVIGVKFSHLCTVPENLEVPIRCATDLLLEKITNSFEDKIINNPEVNPQLVSLLLDLDYFIASNGEAYIGEEIATIDIGSRSIDIVEFHTIERIERKVIEKLKSINYSSDKEIKLAMIGSIETDESIEEEEIE